MKRQLTPFVEPKVIMTVQEFAERVRSGEKLVILDDMVLDISSY